MEGASAAVGTSEGRYGVTAGDAAGETAGKAVDEMAGEAAGRHECMEITVRQHGKRGECGECGECGGCGECGSLSPRQRQGLLLPAPARGDGDARAREWLLRAVVEPAGHLVRPGPRRRGRQAVRVEQPPAERRRGTRLRSPPQSRGGAPAPGRGRRRRRRRPGWKGPLPRAVAYGTARGALGHRFPGPLPARQGPSGSPHLSGRRHRQVVHAHLE